MLEVKTSPTATAAETETADPQADHELQVQVRSVLTLTLCILRSCAVTSSISAHVPIFLRLHVPVAGTPCTLTLASFLTYSTAYRSCSYCLWSGMPAPS